MFFVYVYILLNYIYKKYLNVVMINNLLELIYFIVNCV